MIVQLHPLVHGYYVFRTERKKLDYGNFAPYLLPLNDKCHQNRGMLKAKTMSLLKKLMAESIWATRTLQCLHNKLKINVPRYSPDIFESVLKKDVSEGTGTIFDNPKVNLEEIFKILSDIDSDETLRDDDLWRPTSSITRSNTTIFAPKPTKPKQQISTWLNNSEDSTPDLSYDELKFMFKNKPPE
tara:strand:- start:4661 stop:5218 length:558 start_codon:yes stop_codon:yes gene_type:complete